MGMHVENGVDKELAVDNRHVEVLFGLIPDNNYSLSSRSGSYELPIPTCSTKQATGARKNGTWGYTGAKSVGRKSSLVSMFKQLGKGKVQEETANSGQEMVGTRKTVPDVVEQVSLDMGERSSSGGERIERASKARTTVGRQNVVGNGERVAEQVLSSHQAEAGTSMEPSQGDGEDLNRSCPSGSGSLAPQQVRVEVEEISESVYPPQNALLAFQDQSDRKSPVGSNEGVPISAAGSLVGRPRPAPLQIPLPGLHEGNRGTPKYVPDNAVDTGSIPQSLLSTPAESPEFYLNKPPLPRSASTSNQEAARPTLPWALSMKGRSSINANSDISKAVFSVVDALKPDDPVLKHAIDVVLEKGDFKPLLEASEDEQGSVERRRAVAAALRALTKRDEDKLNRARLAAADGVGFLVNCLGSSDQETIEHAVTALLNLSLTECVRGYVFVLPGGTRSITNVLRTGSPVAKANSAATLFALADTPERKLAIVQADAIEPLIQLLKTGTLRGKKDAALALFSLSLHGPCRREMVKEGVVQTLVLLLQNPEAGVEEKVVAVLSNLTKAKEGRDAIVEEKAISLLVESAESGSPRTKEDAVSALLTLAQKSQDALNELLIDPPDITLSSLAIKGTPRSKKKAQELINFLKLVRNTLSTGVPLDMSSSTFADSCRSQDDNDD